MHENGWGKENWDKKMIHIIKKIYRIYKSPNVGTSRWDFLLGLTVGHESWV